MRILQLENLSKYYTSQNAVVKGLSDVTLSFSVGEFVAVTGESGSGKSTLAHVLGGILPYESGELSIDGKRTSHYDANDWERYRRDMVGFVSQSYGILAGNTVLENVESALRFGGTPTEHARLAAEEILKRVELSEFKNRRAAKLSSGQKQRLSIARALAKPSRILIADEPTGNLDRENSEKVIRLLKEAAKDRLVILITHEFEEAKHAVTRHIILSDGAVVTDVELSPAREESEAQDHRPPTPSAHTKRRKSVRLVPYVTALTLKSRPIFSSIVTLFLALTSFITFAALGTFTTALDDSTTKIYSSEAFLNGDRDRLIVMKEDGLSFSQADYGAILSASFVKEIDKWGYVNDIQYYYRPEVDYRIQTDIINGPNYHPVFNPDDFYLQQTVNFIGSGHFLRTVPVTDGEILTAGKLPQDTYEILSADADLHVGDRVDVYVKNSNDWSISSHVRMRFTVVGETNVGKGLYFSDTLASTLSGFSMDNPNGIELLLNDEEILLAPFSPDGFSITYAEETPPEATQPDSRAGITDHAFGDSDVQADTTDFPDVYMTAFLLQRLRLKPGEVCYIRLGDDFTYFRCAGTLESAYPRLVLVDAEYFAHYNQTSADNQISVYIKDYAYADRVKYALAEMGYLSVSPFRLGATETDPELEGERLLTLGVCLGTLVLTFLLQLILLRAMFSSLYEHYRLMSNIGLTSRLAVLSLSLLLFFFTVLGEAIGVLAVGSMNALSIARIVGIFKYLEWHHIVLLFIVHFLSACLSAVVVVKTMQKTVFAKAKQYTDTDLLEMEDDAP